MRSVETGEWRLCEGQLNVTQTEGNPKVMAKALVVGKARQEGAMTSALAAGGKEAWNARNSRAEPTARL